MQVKLFCKNHFRVDLTKEKRQNIVYLKLTTNYVEKKMYKKLFLALLFCRPSSLPANEQPTTPPTITELRSGNCCHIYCAEKRETPNAGRFAYFENQKNTFAARLAKYENRKNKIAGLVATVLGSVDFVFGKKILKNNKNKYVCALGATVLGFGTARAALWLKKPDSPRLKPFERHCYLEHALRGLSSYDTAIAPKIAFWKSVYNLDVNTLTKVLYAEFSCYGVSYPLLEADRGIDNFICELQAMEEHARTVLHATTSADENTARIQIILNECTQARHHLPALQVALRSSSQYHRILEIKNMEKTREAFRRQEALLRAERETHEASIRAKMIEKSKAAQRELELIKKRKQAQKNINRARIAKEKAQNKAEQAKQDQINSDHKFAQEMQAAFDHESWLKKQQAKISSFESKNAQIKSDKKLAAQIYKKEQQAAELNYWNKKKADKEAAKASAEQSAAHAKPTSTPTIKIVECSICLENINANLKTTTCGHNFHADCLKDWKARNATCPMCRTKI